MVKKSTRRSWALTAIVALFATVFGVAPAKAADEVTLAASAGTSYSILATDTFTLDAALGVGTDNAFAQQLKYHIANADEVAISYTVSGTVDYTESDVTSASWVVSAKASSTVASTIEIETPLGTSVSDSVEVVVTAFVDADNDSVLDAGEWQAARTVTFHPYSDADVSVVMTAMSEGSLDGYEATVTWNNINDDQLDNVASVSFQVNGAVSGSDTTAVDGVYSVSGTVSADATFSAVVFYGAGNVEMQESATITATNRTIDTVTASAVEGANVKDGTAGVAIARANSAFSVKVVTATSSSETVVGAIAGTMAVTSDATLAADKVLTVAGTAYTDNDDLPTAAAFTTNASGEFVLAIETEGFLTSEKITVSFTAQNYTTTLEIQQQTASYTVASVDGDYAYGLEGSDVVLNFKVTDQWDALSTLADRLKVSVAAVSGETPDIDDQYVALSSGQASATITGNPVTHSMVISVSAELQEQDSATRNWSLVAGQTSTSVKVEFTTATPAFDTDPSSVSTSVSQGVAIQGSANLEGAVVTVTGAGLVLENMEGDTASGVITARVGASGDFTITASSDIAGDYPVTVAVGTYSEEIVVTVDDIAASEATTMTITQVGGSAYVAPGSTLRVLVTLTDDYGNPAKNSDANSLSLTVTGPGFVGTLPTKTDKNGQATVNVLVGSNDSGTITVEGEFDAAETVTSSAEFTVGTEPAADDAADVKVTLGTFQGYAALFVAGADGSKLSVKFAGKWYVVPSIDSGTKGYFLWKRNTGAGYPANVTVYIDGQPVDIKVNGEMVGTTASIVTK